MLIVNRGPPVWVVDEYVIIKLRVSVCVYVCVCVCVCHRYSPYGWSDFNENSHKYSLGYKLVLFFSFL